MTLSCPPACEQLAHSSKPFERDPYGCAQPELQRKRAVRDPLRRGVGYALTNPSLGALLAHCEPTVFRGVLPWSTRVGDDEDPRRFGARQRSRSLQGEGTTSNVRRR